MRLFSKFFKKHGKSMAMAAGLTLASTSNPALANDSLSHTSITPTQYSQQVNESHLPPGFRSDISLDPALAIVYENLRGSRKDFTMDQIFEILAGRSVGEFHLRYNVNSQGEAMMGSILPAWKCDGGYAFLSALYVKEKGGYHAAQSPTAFINSEQLKKESPSMPYLMAGMRHFLRGEYSRAEPELINSIFINIYGESLGLRKAGEYTEDQSSKDQITKEIKEIISNMHYNPEEYKQCNPSSESTRLMLAQWGSYFLNTIDEISDGKGKPWKRKKAESSPINDVERTFWRIEYPIKKRIGTYIRGPPEYFEPIEYYAKSD